jgi:hypothetical protein
VVGILARQRDAALLNLRAGDQLAQFRRPDLTERSLEEHALAGYQDLSVWEKTAGREHPD